MRHHRVRATLVVALAVCAIAAWRIGVSLVAPDGPPGSAASLLAAPAAIFPQADESRRQPGTHGPAAGQDLFGIQGPAGTGGLPEPSEAAVARARARLRAEPLSAEAYAVLALAAEKAGEDERAGRLMAIAAAWWPRDFLVRTWLLARELRRGDLRAAMAQLDLALRVRPDSLDALTAALSPLLTEPAYRLALTERLAGDPPWRTRFIQVALRLWREPEGLIALLDHLQATPSGLDPEELRPYLTRLLAAGQVDEAYAAWLRSLPAEARASLGYLYNGDLRRPVTQMPFDWRMPALPGAKAVVSGTGGGPVLSVGFLGGRVAGQPVVHELVLAPGNYRLTGRVRADRLRSERGIRWRVACLTDPRGALGASDAFAGTAAWRDFALNFTVPEEGCPAQSLGLEADARTALETQVSGVVSFSELDIIPLDGGSAPPPVLPRPPGETRPAARPRLARRRARRGRPGADMRHGI